MTEFKTQVYENGTRLRWVYDEQYQTLGSYAYDTDEETREAEQWELERLADGRLVPLGCIIELRARGCDCPNCTGWHPHDELSLWGIVIEPDDNSLHAFAVDNGWIAADESLAA